MSRILAREAPTDMNAQCPVWAKGHIVLNASGTDIGFFHFIRLSIGVGIIFLLRGFAKWALLFI